MKSRKTITVIAATLFMLPIAGRNGCDNVVWFDKPTSLKGAKVWFGGHPEKFPDGKLPLLYSGPAENYDKEWEYKSMPVGNGNIGANVLGSVSVERLTLNEKSLWQGGPGTGVAGHKGTAEGAAHYWNANRPVAQYLPEIRQAFADGDWQKAARLTQQHFVGNVSYERGSEEEFRFGCFTTLGELCVETGIDEDAVSGYRRALSLDSALATVSFDYKGVHYDRNTFVSYPDNMLVMRFSAARKGLQNLSLNYTPNPAGAGSFTPDGRGGLCYNGKLYNNGMEYTVRIRAIARGGIVRNESNQLRIENADEVMFLLTADTDYKMNFDPDFNDPKAYVGVDPKATTAMWIKRAERKSYTRLLRDHYADYSALFNRVDFALDGAKASDKPIDQRLADYRKGVADPDLETLYYQFGRYLLIASSRPGNLPANLQGIWHNNVDGPWHIDYHNNINLQMNYWPALSTNLSECMKPLTDFIRLLEKPGEITAKSYWNARGWAAGISANIFGFTAPLTSHDLAWNYNPMAASWLATHLWDYYDFTRDRKYLRDIAYPLIKGCALFTQDFLWLRSDGTYTAAPSTSPEHGPIDEGATFNHGVARDILDAAIRAAEVLDVDHEQTGQWKHVLEHIAPYQVGRYGQLMEWSRDIDDPNDQHRHVNHLYGLHPGHSISPITTPSLAKASRVVLEHRGDGATGWSMGWKLNQWARLHDGNHSYLLYGNLLKNGTADNLWDVHPPFQIDGNFGGTSGVTEMLLQSHAGFIHLLPALPDAWNAGHIHGLRARGNFGVDIDWQSGHLLKALITSGSGESCTVRYGNESITFPTKAGKRYYIVYDSGKLSLIK